jgi:aryl-alcohol dehydrogenase-like predicted oxidoreductase
VSTAPITTTPNLKIITQTELAPATGPMTRLRSPLQILGPVSRLGLGCSRLGSVLTTGSTDDALNLIAVALDSGITFFDTADIYGQGQSEQLLSKALKKRDGFILGTKVGQRFSQLDRFLLPLKKPLVAMARCSSTLRARIATRRSGDLPRDFAPLYLRRAVEMSLRRLGRECADIVYLHSPRLEHLRSGDAVGALDRMRAEGKVRVVGVACDTPQIVWECLKDERISVLQVPFGLNSQEFRDSISVARSKGIAIIAREILKGARNSTGPLPRNTVQDCVRFVVAEPHVDVALIGTTSAAHLRECVAALRNMAAE